MDSGDKGADYGTRLRRWRNGRRLTQQQLAEALDYDISYIRKLEGGVRPPTPTFLARLSEVAGSEAGALLRPTDPAPPRPRLPQPTEPMVGREADVDAVASLLSGPIRFVTLTGPPGIGKTRIAMAVATRFEDLAPDGAWWISLTELVRPEEVAGQMLRALEVAKRVVGDPIDTVIDAIRDRTTLLVIDNFEQVMPARSLMSRIVAETSHVRLLLTSREALGLQSEHVFRIHPLSFPDPGSRPTLKKVRHSAAVELFVARAKMARPTFELDADNSDAVLSVCAHLDGIPLAIVLTAGAVQTIDARELASLLAQGVDLSYRGPVDMPSHHRTVEAAIGWSWERLATAEQELLASMAVFSGGWTADAAASVAGVTSGVARSLLERLSRKSLVEAQPDAASGPRFDLLETIRRFLSFQLERSGRTEIVRRRHRDYFVGFAEACSEGLRGGDQVRCTNAFADELRNLTLAFDSSLVEDPGQALKVASNSWRYFLLRDIPAGQLWLDAALKATSDPTAARAMALAAAGALAWITGHPELAAQRLDAAAALAELLHLSDITALVMVNLGALAEQQDRLGDAENFFSSALTISHQLNDRRGQAVALNGLGMVNRRRAQIDEAWSLWTQAAALFQEVGDGANQALVMGNLAWAAERSGRLDDAEAVCRRCRAIQIAVGDGRGSAATTSALGRIAFLRERFAEARELQLEALHSFLRLADRPWMASTVLGLAAVSERTGDTELAAILLGAAEKLWGEMRIRPREEEQALLDSVILGCLTTLTETDYVRARLTGQLQSTADTILLLDSGGRS